MSSFVNALRSESTKMFSLRSTWIWAILLTGALYGPMVLMGVLAREGTEVDWQILLVGGVIFSMLAVSYSGSTVAAEYSDKMVAHAFLTQDRRSHWLVSRIVLLGAFLAANGVIGGFLAWCAVTILPKTEFVGGNLTQIWTTALTTLVFGVVAVGIAVLTRSRVAAVAAPLAWMLVVEQLLKLAAQVTVGRVFWLATPGARVNQIAETLGAKGGEAMSDGAVSTDIGWQAMQTQPMWFNVAVVLAWVGVTLAVAFLINSRRDVR